MRLRFTILVFLSSLLVLTPGCAGPPNLDTFAPKAAHDEEVAILKNTSGFGWVVSVRQIDGKNVVYPQVAGGIFGEDTRDPIRIQPGLRRLTVRNDGGVIVFESHFSFPFAAGHAYQLTRIGALDQRPRIDDLTAHMTYPLPLPMK